MTLTQLRYILALNECRNFAQAAELCCVSQPTLSLQIKKLESIVQEAIWDRHQTPIQPTPFGEVFIRQAANVLNEVERLERLSHKESPDLEGSLTLGIIPTVAHYLFIEIYQKLTKAFPKLKLTLHELPTSQMLDRLEQGSLDLALLAGPVQHRHLQERPLYYEPFCVQLHNKAQIHSKDISMESLQKLPLLMLSEEHCLRGQTMKLCKHSEPTQNKSHLECTSIEIMKRLVSAHIASAILPLFCAKPHLLTMSQPGLDQPNEPSDQLIADFQSPSPARVVSLVSRKNFYYSRRMDAVASAVLASVPSYFHSKQHFKIIGIDQNV